MRLSRLFVVVPVLVALSACDKSSSPSGGSTPTAEGGAATEGKTKVAFLLATLQEERYLMDKKYF